MSQLSEVAKPGMMISQTWPNSRETPWETLRAIEATLEIGFFEALQTVEIPYPDERKAIATVVSQENIPLTYCISRVLNENDLNLSDLDPARRKRSWEAAIRSLDDARDAGAVALAFVSGPAPTDPARRPDGLKCLEESLEKICTAARIAPAVQVVLEPLDYAAHKRFCLGRTVEAAELCGRMREAGLELFLCLDTAHLILNEEDPLEALRTVQKLVPEFHFCNCVTDRSHPLFGDRHLPFGPPGVMDVDGIAAIMRGAHEAGYLNPWERPGLFCEVLKRPEDKSTWILHHVLNALKDGWERAQEKAGQAG